MKEETIKFRVKRGEVRVQGIPELGGVVGISSEDGMAFFFGKGYEFYVANIETGKIRQLASCDGYVLVDDSDIDLDVIARWCTCGIDNARAKAIRYARLNRYDEFKKGICAISWVLYPDGRFFADSDGFGMEPNNEEVVYAIMNKNLDIIEPFRPIDDIREYLKQLRKSGAGKTKKSAHNRP